MLERTIVSKIRDWEDYNEDESFEKFSHKAKLIRQRKEDIIRQKRKEKMETLEYEKNMYQDSYVKGE